MSIKIESKLFTFILLFTFISLMIIPFASASSVSIAYDTYSSTASNYSIYTEHPSSTSIDSAFGQVFLVVNTGYVTSIEVGIKKGGDPSGSLNMKICSTITDGTTGRYEPNNTDILELSSRVIQCDDLTTSMTKYTFVFDGTLQLVKDSRYAWVLYCSDDQYMDSLNDMHIAMAPVQYYPSQSDEDKYLALYYNGNSEWHAYSNSDDFYFLITGDTIEATPTPTPDPSATPTSAPSATTSPELENIYTTIGNLFSLTVPLLVVVLPAFFGYKMAGAWGFLAGINIGAILAYAILGSDIFPLWGIVVILILDALLLFGKVGFHS